MAAQKRLSAISVQSGVASHEDNKLFFLMIVWSLLFSFRLFCQVLIEGKAKLGTLHSCWPLKKDKNKRTFRKNPYLDGAKVASAANL